MNSRSFWVGLFDKFITAIVVITVLAGLAYALGSPQRDAASQERVTLVLLELERHRYMTDCLLVTPIEGRSARVVQLCQDRALTLQPGDSADELIRTDLIAGTIGPDA